MAFKNEYGTEKDIEKYHLKELWSSFHAAKKAPFYGRAPEVTIDRDNDIVMMLRSTGPVPDGTQYNFLLQIRGQVSSVILNLVKGSSPRFDDRPFYRVWDFVLIKKRDTCTLADDEIIANLKPALTAFGYHGIRQQVPDTVVKFNF